jgi:hypothetical protein
VVELRDCRSPMKLTQNALDLLYVPPSACGTEAVSVINAHAATKAERDELVKAAGTSRKTYRCVVWAARVVNHEDLKVLEKAFVNVELQQMTPIRVLHRRTSAVRVLSALWQHACSRPPCAPHAFLSSLQLRKRTVHWIKCSLVNSHWFLMDICADGGTYIKEFVHGDRHVASLAAALVAAFAFAHAAVAGGAPCQICTTPCAAMLTFYSLTSSQWAKSSQTLHNSALPLQSPQHQLLQQLMEQQSWSDASGRFLRLEAALKHSIS